MKIERPPNSLLQKHFKGFFLACALRKIGWPLNSHNKHENRAAAQYSPLPKKIQSFFF
jgi:hypothetical protein